MNNGHELDEAATVDEAGDLDPRTAAALLEHTTRRAKRQFEFPSPLLTLIQAAAILVAYGAVWLSVRGQDPYTGPSLSAVAVLYVFVTVAVIAATWDVRRATAGVSGRSTRQRWTRALPFVAAYLAVYVLMGALRFDGFSTAIVYGIIPAAGPLIVVGAALAGDAAAREDWLVLGTAVAVIGVGAGSAFAGPSGVWGVAGVGLFAVVVLRAVVQLWRRA